MEHVRTVDALNKWAAVFSLTAEDFEPVVDPSETEATLKAMFGTT